MSASGPIGISSRCKTNRRNVTSRKIWIFIKTAVITIWSGSLLVYGEADLGISEIMMNYSNVLLCRYLLICCLCKLFFEMHLAYSFRKAKVTESFSRWKCKFGLLDSRYGTEGRRVHIAFTGLLLSLFTL
jgi:hypothetical protein